MTTSLEKYNKKDLATLRLDRLIAAVDGTVRNLFESLDEANGKYAELVEAHKSYKDKDPEVERCFQIELHKSKTSVQLAIKEINDYMDEQKALFASMGLPPERAYTWAIVPTGGVNEHGKINGRMIKRGVPLEQNGDLSDDEDRSVRATMRLPSERFDILSDMRRGKYHDAGFLVNEAVCGIDRSETNYED